jgi:hypothetical protein
MRPQSSEGALRIGGIENDDARDVIDPSTKCAGLLLRECRAGMEALRRAGIGYVEAVGGAMSPAELRRVEESLMGKVVQNATVYFRSCAGLVRLRLPLGL